MSRKTLFFLSSETFHAQLWKHGKLSSARHFPNTAEGREKLADFLRAHRDPAYLLVDLIEEDFRQETVPHLTGSNHEALLQRKFDQFYRNTPFRLARLQQRQNEGRRDDELLFSALTNPARITPWLDLILLHKTPLVGIYSTPHASIPLIKDIASDHLLLLSWEKGAGLRQSYFFNKRLRFSRLTPIPPGSSFADTIATESARTHQYLQSLSLTPEGQLLNVHIICHAKDRTHLDAQLSSGNHMRYAYLDVQLLAKHIKLQHASLDSDATPLFLHLLATQPPRASYATAVQTHYYQLWQTQRGLFALAAAAALTALVWSVLSLLEANGVEAEIDSFNIEASRISQQTQEITQRFPQSIQDQNGYTVTAADMKTAVTLFRNLQQFSVPPQQILAGLTATLDNFPRIHTVKISWQSSNTGTAPDQEITFNGELTDFGNDFRDSLNYLERFQLILARAGYTVTPLKLPLDFSTKGSISADINLNRTKTDEFSLKLIWRPAT